jgi:hypothetical protein
LNDNFFIEEYKSLRAQLDYQISHSRDLERNVLVGCGAIYAWLAKETSPSLLSVPAWLFPVLIVAAGRIRAIRLMKRIDKLGAYIRSMESAALADSSGLRGWETELQGARATHRSPGLGKSHRSFWGLLLGFTVAALLYGVVVQSTQITIDVRASCRRAITTAKSYADSVAVRNTLNVPIPLLGERWSCGRLGF